ncbi:MAG: Uma2 family endonuclease [Candidatus Tectomicrobia bacterium]|nr:Uma2 family endonuclease [Candidatus Tectomicrobia bacterium]
MPRSTLATPGIEYPDSDGQPMAETDFQRTVMTYAIEALKIHFQEREEVYVSGDLFIYYEEGNRAAAVAPDVFVAFGVGNDMRRTYLLWQEGKAPDFVMEVTSLSTREEDQGPKRELYARLGIAEYWQYDPTGAVLEPALQGFTLSGGRYDVTLVPERVGAVWSAFSPVLGLNLRLVESKLRFHDPTTNAYLLTHQESEQARLQAESRVAELEARLRAL